MFNIKRQPLRKWKIVAASLFYCLLFLFVSCSQAKIADQEISEPEITADIEGEIVSEADINPTPVGGMNLLYSSIGDHLVYPEEAKKLGIEGKVFIEFVITKEGKLVNPKIVKGIMAECDNSALLAVQNLSLEWIPGQIEGIPVNMKMVLPIAFAMD